MSAIISRLRRLFVLGLSSLLPILLLVPTGQPQAAAAPKCVDNLRPWTPKTDTGIFVYPATAKKSQQDVFVDRVVKALDATPKGATIRMSTHGTSDPEIDDALHRAIERCVYLRYITWDGDVENNDAQMIRGLKSDLGTNYKTGDQYLRTCDGSCNVKSKDFIHHTKSITISEVVGADGKRYKYLVFTGSSNATENSSSRSWQHNQLVVGAKYKKYYMAWAKYFDNMRYDTNHFYSKPVKDHNFTVYFYPTQAKNPVNPQLQLLRDITSCKAKKGSGVKGTTQIDLMMFSWNKSEMGLAKELVKLADKKHGCTVQVAITADQVDSSIIRVLKKGRLELINTRDTGQFNHSKLLVVSGTVNGKAANIIVSGSLNAVHRAMLKNDEYLVKTTGVRSVVLEAFDFFDNMKANGKKM